jgi:hypothetical protein
MRTHADTMSTGLLFLLPLSVVVRASCQEPASQRDQRSQPISMNRSRSYEIWCSNFRQE